MRTCKCIWAFPISGNDRTGCVEIWSVVRDPLVMRFTQTKGGVHLHVCTLVPVFHISGTVGRIMLQFDMRVEGLTSYARYIYVTRIRDL